jgi:integrase/recombinase XerD
MEMSGDDFRERFESFLEQSGQVVPNITVKELRKRIIKEKGRLSKKTLSHYEWLFDKLEAYTEYWLKNAREVNEFIGSLDGLGDESVLLIFKSLRAIGRYTKMTYGWLDPTERANRPKVSKKRRRYLNVVELKAVAGACREGWEKALVMVLLDSSARIGEVAGLKVEDLEDNGFKVKRGKTGQRRYRCDPRIVALMREIAVDDVVFPMMDSSRKVVRPARPCRGEILGDRVNVIMKRAGLKGEKLGPHTLRHTAASIVARESMSSLAVKALLQHDDISTSMKYIHDVEEGIQDEFSPMGLSGLRMVGDERQITMGEEVKMLPETVDIDRRILVEELFPNVPGGVRVRPALDTEDLSLIRDGMVQLMVARGETGSGSRCVQLMRRMLRRV